MHTRLNPNKVKLSKLFDCLGVFKLFKLGIDLNNKNYIRIVNYHSVPEDTIDNFKCQLSYFRHHFENINEYQLYDFLAGKFLLGNKPGIMITFDDGFLDNYKIAVQVLKEFGFTGYFFIAPDYISQKKNVSIYSNDEHFMKWEHLKQLKAHGHVIGCHTKTHHRMSSDDDNDILQNEIILSKKEIDLNLSQNTSFFCWVGGEENTYTKSAMDVIKLAGYKYAFTTMAGIVTPESDPMFLLRTNIESDWPMSVVKFQIWGPMDLMSRGKRRRVYKKIMN